MARSSCGCCLFRSSFGFGFPRASGRLLLNEFRFRGRLSLFLRGFILAGGSKVVGCRRGFASRFFDCPELYDSLAACPKGKK